MDEFDISKIKALYRNRRISVQHWNYDRPLDNGEAFLGFERCQLTLRDMQRSLQDLLAYAERAPHYVATEVTHIIVPEIPGWLETDTAPFTAVLLLRGRERAVSFSTDTAVLGF